MKKENINQVFIDSYLTSGKTYDNFIFENCPLQFMKIAKNCLSVSKNGVKSVVVTFTDKEEAMFEATVHFLNDYQTKIMARNYVCAKILKEIVKDVPNYEKMTQVLANGLNAMISGDLDNAIGFNVEAPLPCDIIPIAKKIGKIELNIFVVNTHQTHFQQVINTFISMRTPFSIKLFTNNEKLTTYYDQSGCIIECPHDFMRRNVRDFINDKEEVTAL